jgi:hypothetical protein
MTNIKRLQLAKKKFIFVALVQKLPFQDKCYHLVSSPEEKLWRSFLLKYTMLGYSSPMVLAEIIVTAEKVENTVILLLY